MFAISHTGISETGHPVGVFQIKLLSDKLFEKFTVEEFCKWLIKSYENLVHVIMPRCCQINGYRTDMVKTIIDFKVPNMGNIFKNKKILECFKMAAKIGNDCYPEGVLQIIIINAPTIFKMLWFMIKG